MASDPKLTLVRFGQILFHLLGGLVGIFRIVPVQWAAERWNAGFPKAVAKPHAHADGVFQRSLKIGRINGVLTRRSGYPVFETLVVTQGSSIKHVDLGIARGKIEMRFYTGITDF